MLHQFVQRSGQGDYIDCKFSSNVEIYDTPKMKESLIYGGQFFDSPNILRSHITDFCRISGRPTIRDSRVKDTAQILGYSKVLDSIIEGNSVVSKNSTVHESTIKDNARLLDKSFVSNCIIGGQAIVCGTASLWGERNNKIVLGDWDYVSEGRWKRRPITYVASSGFVVSESINRNVTVSCTTNTVEKWLGGAGRRYGKIVGLDNSQCDEIIGYIEVITDIKNQSDYKDSGWENI